MIAVCEPICREMSHEKVNSGFIHGLDLAFPGEGILFYADTSHIEAIKQILEHDNVFVRDIEYHPIKIMEHQTGADVAIWFFKFLRFFSRLVASHIEKVFFLSFTPEMLFAIKLLKGLRRFEGLRFTFVLHGGFESIVNDPHGDGGIVLPRTVIVNPATTDSGLWEKLKRTKVLDIPPKIVRKIAAKIPARSSHRIMTKVLSVKRAMEWRSSKDFHYVALSPHIMRNASKYIDTKRLNLYSMILPTVFVEPAGTPQNEHVKFGVFGYGDSLVLHNVAFALSNMCVGRPYEIRIIGMDNRGTSGFANITCTSTGNRLTRSEMERHARDIDAFLILYDNTRYRLSCSGSVLEALSMMKPIVHFDNECVNEFNRPECPIGFRCHDFEDFVHRLVDIIQNYERYRDDFLKFRNNILEKRKQFAIEKSVPALRACFIWND